ncbi:MAG: hypothetical protein KGL34_01710 [Gammaproteobacteria bacterium]|nr:hypothetical protein [Gammaproteobacteria bacterium]
MRPLTVLFGILLGTSVSATFSLAVLSIIYSSMSGSHPELAGTVPRLVSLLVGFACLTAAAAASFLGQLQLRAWRSFAHIATVAVICAMILRYALVR